MKKKREAVILTIISIVLIYFIFIAWTNVKGYSSKQVKEAINFLRKIERIGAIEGEVIPNAKDFKEVNVVNGGDSTIKYTLVADNYGVDLDQNYNVIGFSNQDISLAGQAEIDSEHAIKIAKEYLSEIVNDKVIFKEVKNIEDENNPFYTISFYKYYKSYINYSYEIILKINKYNGNLLAYSAVNNTSKNYNKDINITKKKAIEIVKNHFDKLDIKGVGEGVGWGYVYIDEDRSQLCYLVNYKITSDSEIGGIHQVYVSTSDGSIVKESIKSEVIGKVNE